MRPSIRDYAVGPFPTAMALDLGRSMFKNPAPFDRLDLAASEASTRDSGRSGRRSCVRFVTKLGSSWMARRRFYWQMDRRRVVNFRACTTP